MASVCASSPEEQPALQARTGAFFASRPGSTLVRTASHVSGFRKKRVTLIVSASCSRSTSSGVFARTPRYSS